MWGQWLDSSGLERFYQKLKNVFVQKDGDKVLSTNDYTTAEKEKLSGIEATAQVNKIELIKMYGTNLPINNKAVNIPVMTGATSTASSQVGLVPVATSANRNKFLRGDGTWQAVQSEITIDNAMSSTSENPVQNKVINSAISKKANIASPTFTGTPSAPTATSGTNTTQIATTAFVKNAIDNAISGIIQFRYNIVSALPTTGNAGTIYLIANSHGTNDAYDEYMYLDSGWEKIGTTDIDLSGYATKSELSNYAEISDLSNIPKDTIDSIVV